jgi:hypothetical protein
MDEPLLPVAVASGAVAGTVVDISLFPIDTIKTRLQAGGNRQVKGSEELKNK